MNEMNSNSFWWGLPVWKITQILEGVFGPNLNEVEKGMVSMYITAAPSEAVLAYAILQF